MGNFAENLNLGKRVLPPPLLSSGSREMNQFGTLHAAQHLFHFISSNHNQSVGMLIKF